MQFLGLAWPEYCPTCGGILEKHTERGAKQFRNDEWTLLECPKYKTYTGDWREHYSKIIKVRPYPDTFDPYTGVKK